MNYAEAEEYINQIPRFSKVKSEENVDEILALFGANLRRSAGGRGIAADE